MNKFIKNIALFTVYIVFVLLIMVIIYKNVTGVGLKDIPAPNFSDNYGLNDKMEFIRNRRAKVITIGSSVGLNNINSETLINTFHTNSYSNLSAWGLTTKDIFSLIKVYSPIFKPVLIIMPSSYRDFQNPDKNIDCDELRDYFIDTTANWGFYFKHFNLPYYSANFKFVKFSKASNRFPESLLYDKYGAVLSHAKFKPGPDEIEFTNLREDSYRYLDSISNYCRQNKINLIVIQSPIRSGIYANIDKKEIQKHINRVKQTILENNQIFIDPNERLWADSLFINDLHFNANGAKQFTEYCVGKIKPINFSFLNH